MIVSNLKELWVDLKTFSDSFFSSFIFLFDVAEKILRYVTVVLYDSIN